MAVSVGFNINQHFLYLSPRKSRPAVTDKGCPVITPRPRRDPVYKSANLTVDSVARRLFKRSALCLRRPTEDVIFAHHAANTDEGTKTEQGDPTSMMHTRRSSKATVDSSHRLLPSSFQVNAICVAGNHRDLEQIHLEAERRQLLASINSARIREKSPPLTLDVGRCEQLQVYADLLSEPDYDVDRDPTTDVAILLPHQLRKSQLSILIKHDDMARISSPASMGALSVAEMWVGGKYKGHLNPVAPMTSMGLEEMRKGMAFSIAQRISANKSSLRRNHEDGDETCEIDTAQKSLPTLPHRPDCDCHLRPIFEELVASNWKVVGIGKSRNNRWIVEVAEQEISYHGCASSPTLTSMSVPPNKASHRHSGSPCVIM